MPGGLVEGVRMRSLLGGISKVAAGFWTASAFDARSVHETVDNPRSSYGKFTGWFVMSNVIQIILFREVSCLLYWALKTALSGPGRGDRLRWST